MSEGKIHELEDRRKEINVKNRDEAYWKNVNSLRDLLVSNNPTYM